MDKLWLDFVGVILAGLAALAGAQNTFILNDLKTRIERLENHLIDSVTAENDPKLIGGKAYAK